MMRVSYIAGQDEPTAPKKLSKKELIKQLAHDTIAQRDFITRQKLSELLAPEFKELAEAKKELETLKKNL
jgi:hypothetical protein